LLPMMMKSATKQRSVLGIAMIEIPEQNSGQYTTTHHLAHHAAPADAGDQQCDKNFVKVADTLLYLSS